MIEEWIAFAIAKGARWGTYSPEHWISDTESVVYQYVLFSSKPGWLRNADLRKLPSQLNLPVVNLDLGKLIILCHR